MTYNILDINTFIVLDRHHQKKNDHVNGFETVGISIDDLNHFQPGVE